ncbi:MAG: metal ABC transporter substrate-binding protein [bacterium]|nr:metal ABC transporter substrate-binding protein [bacterium]
MRSIRTGTFVLMMALLMTFSISAQEEGLNIVATTSIIADVAQNVAGDLATVTSLIPAETDEHTFVPAPNDIITLAEADVLLMNGANLEEGLLEIIEENASVEPTIVSLGVEILGGDHNHEEAEHSAEEAEATEEADHEHGAYEVVGVLGEDGVCEDAHDEEGEAEHDHEHGACDPHVWTDPANVILWVNNIAAALSAADPANADIYAANAEAYIAELEALAEELDSLVAQVPDDQRVIVTNHEFLAYFAHRYGFEVVGTVIPGVTTSAEVAPQDILALIETVEAEGVRVIFAETSATTDLAETIASEIGYEVAIVTLYSGALSRSDGPAATYLDYMRHNTTAIVNALLGTSD